MPPQEEPAEAAEVSASRAPAADAPPGDRVPLHLPIDGAAHTSSAWCDDEYYSAEDGGFALNLSDPNERKLSACLSTNLYPKVQCFDHVTGDWTASAKGSFQKANVCPYRGQLTWTLRVKGETRLVKTVLENTVHWNTVKHRGGTSTMTVVLSNASGDGYQFRFFGG